MEKIYNELEKIAEEIYKSLPFGLMKGLAIYLGLLFGGNYINHQYSPKITSQHQINNIVSRERKNLKIDENVKITVRLLSDKKESCSRKISDNNYEIELHPFNERFSEKTLVHELAHIGYGDCDDKYKSNFEYFFLYEPRAMWYAMGSGNEKDKEVHPYIRLLEDQFVK